MVRFPLTRESDYHVGMTKLSCKGVLFDLDGVLVDSTPAVARVWSWWARKHGFDPENTVRIAHGRPSIATIRELLPSADHEAENREVERREIEDVEGVIPLPGALELLTALSLDRWAIVTSCTKRLAYVRIRAAGLPEPKFIVTSDDINRGKPDPEPYIKGANALSFASNDCIVVEDAPAGIRAGKAAGARVVALQTTERDELLFAAGADVIVKDCAALLIEPTAKQAKLAFDLRHAQTTFR
ncbi:MAG: HAD family hydrolase [Candidatus Acidiferrum sp.]